MRLTFSNSPIDRFSCWFENEVLSPIARYYYTHKKAHYRCCVCGYIIAPYFYVEDYCLGYNANSVTHDYGWHKLKDSGRWICHHCADHGFAPSSENGKPYDWKRPRERTWDEWQEFVKEGNTKVLATMKEKDPEYYDYWFGGEYEDE